MTERTTVRLPNDLIDRARRKAAAEGRTLTALIEEGLRRVVAENRKTARLKCVQPRVSKARGGPLPGIELTAQATLQEMDDLNHVRRMRHFK